MLCHAGIAIEVAAPMDLHSHGHQCYFTSCPLEACRQAQKDAEMYGFNSEGEINFPPRTKLPWELDAA